MEDKMRLWHYKLLPYLPDKQFKGQLRELIAIMHDWRDKGQTNHMLINYVMYCPKYHLRAYYELYKCVYHSRYNKRIRNEAKWDKEFKDFAGEIPNETIAEHPLVPFHNQAYAKICMANLYEKRRCDGMSLDEWETLTLGYRTVWKEEWKI